MVGPSRCESFVGTNLTRPVHSQIEQQVNGASEVDMASWRQGGTRQHSERTFALGRISQSERETRLLELWLKQSEDPPKDEP
jgi:hypothetical protein